MLGAALQQAVGEAAGRGADVERAAPGDVEAERVERVGELHPAARDVRAAPLDVELDVVGHQLAGLVGAAPLRAAACTSPAITAAAARVRDANSPRSASRESRRTRATRGTVAMCPCSQTFWPPSPYLGDVTRSISLPLHSALERPGGLALLAGPFLLGAAPAGLVVGVSLGALLVGMALAGPDALPLTAHQSFDLTLVAVLAGAGLGLALSGDLAGGVVLAVVGALQLTLVSLTRWVRA